MCKNHQNRDDFHGTVNSLQQIRQNSQNIAFAADRLTLTVEIRVVPGGTASAPPPRQQVRRVHPKEWWWRWRLENS